MSRIKNLISILLIFLVVTVTTLTALAKETPVNALGKVTVEEVKESGFLKTLEKIGGKVITRVAGAVVTVLEIAWPDVNSNSIFLEMCVNIKGGKQCTDSDTGAQQIIKVNESAPASYTIAWKVYEGSNNTRCYAFNTPVTIDTSSTVWGINFFENLPYIAPKSYMPNINWKGSIGTSGEAPFTNISEGTYDYNMVCYNEATGNWITNAIDKIMMFGKVTKKAFFTKQQTINVVVGSAGKPDLSVSVDITAKPISITKGQSTTISWKSKNATGFCKGSGRSDWPIVGSFIDTPSATKKYDMTCTGPGGSSKDSVTVTVVNAPPIGYHDSVDNNTCHTTGWAYDPDDSSKSINVHIYRDGPAGGVGVILDSFPTNVFRDGANKQEKISGNHGFDANLAPYISDGKSHKLYVYPIDTTTGLGSPSNPLNRTQKTIQCSAPAPIPGKTPPSVDIKVL